jgi:hypothetical protein
LLAAIEETRLRQCRLRSGLVGAKGEGNAVADGDHVENELATEPARSAGDEEVHASPPAAS